jgi:hypothetical protein
MSLETRLTQGVQNSLKDHLIDEVTVTAQREWLRGEVPLAEMLEDPIVRLVMERDGLDKEQVQAAFLAAATRSKCRRQSRILTIHSRIVGQV